MRIACCRYAWAACVAAASLIATRSEAQGPQGATSLAPAAVAESLSVLQRLSARLGTDSTDASAWYRRGMIAWALMDRARATPEIQGLDWTSLGEMADTSLRLAAHLAPQNAAYRVMVGRYLLASGVSITRFASGGFFQDALDVARKDTNREVHSDAAVEAGRVNWRRYDAVANRRIETSPGGAIRSIVRASQTQSDDNNASTPTGLRSARNALELNSMPLPPEVSGQNDYDQAEKLFREAVDAAPDNQRAFRQYAMVLAEKNRWFELVGAARNRTAKVPWDPWAWMALGLATQRQNDSRGAAVAFDSAMALFGPDDRARFDRIERILRHADTTIVQKGSESDRMATRRLYWLFADPLWSREGNESRIEFLARVAFAELRWTVDELGVHGVDSDRGDIYVRYGPPDLVASFGADLSQDIATVSTLWAYNNGLMFTFEGAPTFGTARIPLDDQRYVNEIEDLQPVRWDNLTSFKIDSMPVQIARFRGGAADSVDVLVAAEPPLERIRKSSDLGFTPRADIWLLAGGTVGVFRDSSTLTAPGVKAWTHRVKPGNYVARIEATTDGGKVAGRATSPIVASTDPLTGFSGHGFGISDMVMAARVEPRGNSRVIRWTDLQISPITSAIATKSQLSLVWENYDFGMKDGSAQYTVAVIVQRDRSAAGRIMARVISGVSGAVGIDRTDDRIAMRFDRTLPYTPAIADYVTISLEDTPPGTYRITLEITDTVSGKTSARTGVFSITK